MSFKLVAKINIAILGALTLFCGCTTTSNGSKEVGFINSFSIKKSLEKQTLKLVKDKKTVPIATLKRQLARSKCKVQLESPKSSNQSLQDIYQNNKKSTLLVGALYKCGKCPNWHASVASGFFLTSDGIICTNYHVVDSSQGDTLVVMTSDGTVYPVEEVLAGHKGDDIAIIRIAGNGFTPLSIVDNTPVGSPACLISNPSNNYYAFTSGIISRYFKIYGKEKKLVDRMAITADFAGGSSGAAIFGEKGNVIGMVTATRSLTSGKKKNLQMVIKMCVPAKSILKIIGQ